MSIKDRPLPQFEAPLSYEQYAESGMYGALGAASNDVSEIVPTEPEIIDEAVSFDVRVSQVVTCIGAQNSLREVLYKTLDFCQDVHEFSEVEHFISSQDEFVYSHIMQTPYTLIQMLKRAGGLEETLLDADGKAISPQQLDCIGDDEVDDLIVSSTLVTTDAGAEAVRLLAPEHRIEAQLAKRPHRRDTYFAVLEFCLEPRKFPEIEALFKATPNLVQDVVAHHHKLSPDFYVDKLDKAGALVWRGAWITTDAGKSMLAAHKAEQQKATAETAVSHVA